MKKMKTSTKCLIALLATLMCVAAQAQVVAEESADSKASAQVNYTPQYQSVADFGYGIYLGGGYSVTTPSLNDNFGGCFLFQVGAVGTYKGFQLKTDVQFGQPGYRNDNIFNTPAYDEQGHPAQVNGNSSASFFAWSLQLGYKVYSQGRFGVTPNVGLYYSKYSWNLENLKWEKNEEGEYVPEHIGTESAKLSSLGVIGSLDIDYTFSTTKMKNPFTGSGDNQFKQSIRFSPFVAYSKYDKCNPTVSGAFVGMTINYTGLLHALGF